MRISPSGRCEPVSTTGLSSPVSANDSADAVYAIVSVPWMTTTPSCAARAAATSSASALHSSGPTSDESRLHRILVSIVASAASSGTRDRISCA